MKSGTRVTSGTARERAWVEVNPAALVGNLLRIKDVVGPGTKLIPMVKADGYGLGMEAVVGTLREAAPFGFGVATVDEGLALRAMGVSEPVMIYSPVPAGALGRALDGGLVPSFSDSGGLTAFAAEAVGRPDRASFQIEVDTGMGRSGFSPAAADEWWGTVRDALDAGADLFGVFTHLHSADEPDLTSARSQVRLLLDFLRGVEGIPETALVHWGNSAGAIRLSAAPEANAVRPGIYLYGGHVGGEPHAEPVVAVRARIGLVRDVEPGTTLGYGATYRAGGPERWATACIGYGDGLPRILGNRGRGIVSGRSVPIIGRISMDMTVVDITGIDDVSVGDVVTFVGRDGGAVLPLDEVAEQAGTISYEILTGLTARLPRVWTEA